MIAAITPREKQVVQEMAEGLSCKMIGAKLGISGKTVEVHKRNIMQKTGCCNGVQLAITLFRLGVIT